MEQELADLGMDGARLVVELTEAPLGARGGDRCELLLAANTGLRPRAAGAAPPRAASCRGSRLRSGWRRAAGGGPATLVLDEVDAGVGGRTARAVGEKLRGWPSAPR